MKKIINLFLLGCLATGMSSCLKDKSLTLPDADGAIKNVIEFKNVDYISSPVSSPYPVYIKSYDILPTGSLTIEVNYAGVDAAPENINVKVVLDPTILTKYNAKIVADARAAAVILGQDPDDAEDNVSGDLFEPLDPALYSIGSMDLTIPAGQRSASFTIALKPNMFDFAKNTALAFKILSASTGTISGNFGNIIVKIGAKNAVDGLYDYTTTATTSLVPNASFTDVPLVTASANTVTTNLLNTYANIMTYRIDFTTNKVTVVSGLGTPVTNPISSWDPAKKVLHAVWTSGPRSFDETFTFKKSR